MHTLKEDIRSLRKEVRQLTEQLVQYCNQTEKRIAESEKNIMDHFDIAVETIRHDLAGANQDEITSLKTRVERLEQHTGLARV